MLFLAALHNLQIMISLGIKTTIIHPATQNHIEKYLSHSIRLIEETPELYKNVTLPHLEATSFNIQVGKKFIILFVTSRKVFL